MFQKFEHMMILITSNFNKVIILTYMNLPKLSKEWPVN